MVIFHSYVSLPAGNLRKDREYAPDSTPLWREAAGFPISVDVNKMTGEIVTGGTPDLLKFCVSELWKENNRPAAVG